MMQGSIYIQFCAVQCSYLISLYISWFSPSELRFNFHHTTTIRLFILASLSPANEPIELEIGKRVKLHAAAADGVHLLPHLWRTRCGRPFARWTFTRHSTAADFPVDVHCRRCMLYFSADFEEGSLETGWVGLVGTCEAY